MDGISVQDGAGVNFEAYGITATPGSDEFWSLAASAVSVPDQRGWLTLFLWRGSPATVQFESWSSPIEMGQVPDTDCWYAQVVLPPRMRLTYQVITADGAHADPLNEIGAGADRSIAVTPDAPPQPHWPAIRPGDVPLVPRLKIRWAGGFGRRTVRVQHVGGGGPLVLLLDGDDWLYLHPAIAAFESAVAAGDMPPATLAFVPSSDRETELTCNRPFWLAVRAELLPLLTELVGPHDHLTVAGQSLGGLSALYAALEFPEWVTGVACQSGSFWWTPTATGMAGALGGSIAARLRNSPDLSGLRVAFDVGEHETEMLPHCALVERLTASSGATVRVSRSASGHDRAGWRHALVRDVGWVLSA